MRRTFCVAIVSLVFLAAAGTRGAWVPSPESRSASSAKSAGGRSLPGNQGQSGSLVGTWKLVSLEPASGSSNPAGVMMLDPAGYMGLAVMQSGRQKYAGSEPTPAEAKSAYESFRAFFGTYVINQAAGSITVHLDGSIDPNLTGTDYQSAFALSGTRLTLKPRPTATGRQDTLVWERIPDLETLTSTHRRLIGFWKLVPNEGDKPQASSNQDQRRGFIIYTAAGQMAVHIMPGGRAKYAGAEPTPEEAKAALRSYTSYFGPYSVNEQDRYLVHQRIGHTIPASIGTNGQRFYEFSGKRLVLRVLSTTFTVPTTLQAAKTEGREPSMITWERISADVSSR